tara:strand:- start:374 stop:523 length:150 start_codon:yes stop_codon:yes gene_type:complete
MANATATLVKSTVVIKNPVKGFIRKLSSEAVKKYEEREQRLIKEGKRKK